MSVSLSCFFGTACKATGEQRSPSISKISCACAILSALILYTAHRRPYLLVKLPEFVIFTPAVHAILLATMKKTAFHQHCCAVKEEVGQQWRENRREMFHVCSVASHDVVDFSASHSLFHDLSVPVGHFITYHTASIWKSIHEINSSHKCIA